MKLIFSVFIFTSLLISCKDKGLKNTELNIGNKDNKLISELVIYDANIISHEEDDNDWYENIPNNQRKKWINHILTTIKSGKISVFQGELGIPTNKEEDKLSKEEVENLLTNPEEITYDHISKVTFAESWYFNPNTAEVQKTVKGVALSARVENSKGEFMGNQRLFWVWFDNINLSNMKLPL